MVPFPRCNEFSFIFCLKFRNHEAVFCRKAEKPFHAGVRTGLHYSISVPDFLSVYV